MEKKKSYKKIILRDFDFSERHLIKEIEELNEGIQIEVKSTDIPTMLKIKGKNINKIIFPKNFRLKDIDDKLYLSNENDSDENNPDKSFVIVRIKEHIEDKI